jgi:hypothetical protein
MCVCDFKEEDRFCVFLLVSLFSLSFLSFPSFPSLSLLMDECGTELQVAPFSLELLGFLRG